MTIENQRHTSEIVAAYVRKNFIPTDQIAGLINSVHSTLSGLGNDVVEELPPVPAVSVRRSVHPDYMICIECGYKGKVLKRHLQSRHGLSVTQYRSRWKLSSNYSTTAANYSERRSLLAKSIGLGRGPAQSMAATPTLETASDKPARRRSSKAVTARTTTRKAIPKKTSPKTSAKKAANRSRSRKSSSGTAKTASAPKAATA